ncbi:hypothetical protein V8E53_003554 [Lactarius tabidus]
MKGMHRLLAPFIRAAAFTSLLYYTALVLAAPGEYLWVKTNCAPHRSIERPRDKSFPRIKIRGPCTLVRDEFTQEFERLENTAFPDDVSWSEHLCPLLD